MMHDSTIRIKTFDYDSIPVGYYDDIYHRRSGAQSKWHHLKFKRLAQFVKPDDVHLDIGCGPGTFIGTLAVRNRPSIGVDIAEAQIVWAQRRYADSDRFFLLTTPAKLPFRDATFDLITIIELIEHLSPAAVDELLQESLRVLKPDGRIVVSTPNYRSLWPFLEILVNALGQVSYRHQHINRFGPHRLRKLLQECGFQGVHVSAYQGFAPFFAGIAWDLADTIDQIEAKSIAKVWGHSLLGMGFRRE